MDDHAFVIIAISVIHSDILICSTITLNLSAFVLDGREGPTPKYTEPQLNGSHVRSADVHSAANRIHCSQSVRFLSHGAAVLQKWQYCNAGCTFYLHKQ